MRRGLSQQSNKIAFIPYHCIGTAYNWEVSEGPEWKRMPESIVWDRVRLSAKTDCITPSKQRNVQSEPILSDNVLWWRVEPVCAAIQNRWIGLEAKNVHLCIKVCFKLAMFEDEFWVREFMGDPKYVLNQT